MILAAESLCKTYPMGAVEIRALQDVSFQIESGEFVAIMGPSGSGKSTLMHLLGFLDVPDAGTLRFNGRDVSRLSEKEYALLRNRAIGFIFQQFNLMARSTAIENVALPLLYSPDRGSVSAAEHVLELLRRVGLGDRLEHRPNELSGGQQQRVAIARALVRKPLLILADEPTGNLDTKTADGIFTLLRRFNRERNTTFLIVTHDPRLAGRCDRIIQLVDGRIVGDRRRGEGPEDGTFLPPT